MLEDLNVGDVVVPLDVEDDTEGALLKTFQQADVTAIEDSRLCTKKQS